MLISFKTEQSKSMVIEELVIVQNEQKQENLTDYINRVQQPMKQHELDVDLVCSNTVYRVNTKMEEIKKREDEQKFYMVRSTKIKFLGSIHLWQKSHST